MIKCITTGLNVCGPDLDLKSLALSQVNKYFIKLLIISLLLFTFPDFM